MARREYGPNENVTITEEMIADGDPVTSGSVMRIRCPIHGSDSQRSGKLDLGTGRFYCFQCKAWGFTDKAKAAFQNRGRRKGPRGGGASTSSAPMKSKTVEPVRGDLKSWLKDYQRALRGSPGEEYLLSRGIPLKLAREFGIGYAAPGQWLGRDAPGGRLVFPHTTPEGCLVNLYGRAIEGRKPVSRSLIHDHISGNKGAFNAEAFSEGTGPLIVCEGPFDALSLIAAGCTRTVAIFGVDGWRWGWAKSVERITLALDADAAGKNRGPELQRQARIRAKKVTVLSPEALGGFKDANEAWCAGKLEVGTLATGKVWQKPCETAAPPRPLAQPDVRVVRTAAEMRRACRVARKAGRLAVAVCRDDRGAVNGVALATSNASAWYVPFQHRRLRRQSRRQLRGLLIYGVQLVCHDAPATLRALGPVVSKQASNVFDTEVGYHLVRRGADSDLGAIRKWLADVKFSIAPDPRSRAVADACLIVSLNRALAEHVATHHRELFEILMKFVPVLVAASGSHVPVNVKKARRMRRPLVREVAVLENKIMRFAGRRINWGDPRAVARLVYGDDDGCLGLTPLEEPPYGELPSTGWQTLIKLAEDDKFVLKIARLRLLKARLDSVVAPVARSKGYITCGYNQSAQVTGRVSCTGRPNMVGAPKPIDKANARFVGRVPDVRELFIAGKGFVLVAIDFSNFELAILAALAGELQLCALIRKGADLHARLAKKLFGLGCLASEVERRHPAQRSKAKTLQFGILFGQGAAGVARDLGITPPEAQRLIDRYFEVYPRLGRYIKRVQRDALRRGVVTEPAGRLRQFPELANKRKGGHFDRVRAEAERQAVNFAPQSFGSAIFRLCGIAIFNFLNKHEPAAEIIALRHDELMLRLPENSVNALVPRLKKLAEGVDLSSYSLDVPLRVKVRVGQTWAGLRDWQTV